MDGMSKVARIGQAIVGLVYLIAGALKVWDPVLFYWQTLPYLRFFGLSANKELSSTLAQVTTLLGPIELALGLALICNWRPRIALPIASALMAYFTVMMIGAWHMGASVDCGCFGALVQRTPGEAAVEDGVMLALLLFAWWRMRRQASAEPASEGLNWWGAGGAPVWPQAGRVVGCVLIAGAVVGGMRFFPELDRITRSDLRSGVNLAGLTLKGVEVDLMEGEYLLEVFSPKCIYCKKAVPKLNALAQDPELPQLIALTTFALDSQAMIDFKEQLKPLFDMASVSQTDFLRLTYGHGFPRLAYIADGVVQQVWERNQMPSAARLRKITGS